VPFISNTGHEDLATVLRYLAPAEDAFEKQLARRTLADVIRLIAAEAP